MFLSIFNQSPLFAVMVIVGFVVGITVHEAAHAFTAWRLGDATAYRQGRVTLNPAAHLDPLGSVLLVIAGFGWGRPVPVDVSRIKGGVWGPVAVALAGPASNLVVVVVSPLCTGWRSFRKVTRSPWWRASRSPTPCSSCST